MKRKLFITAALSILFFSCLTTKEEVKTEVIKKEPELKKEKIILFNDDPGVYVYYNESKADGTKRLLGFLYTGENKFILRVYNPVEKKDIKIKCEVSVAGKENHFDFSEKSADLSETESIEINELLNAILKDYFDLKNTLKDSSESKKSLIYKGAEFENTFKNWIPFFYLYNMENKADKKNNFKLDKIGVLYKKDDPQFYQYMGRTESFEGFDFRVPQKKSSSVILNNTLLSLDENWSRTMSTNRTGEPLETFAISKNVIKYSEIFIENINISSLNINSINELIRLKIYLEKDNHILPETVIINNKTDKTIFNYEMINNTFKVKYNIFSVIIKNNNDIKIINLIIYNRVYMLNKNYFDKIINEMADKINFT